MQIGEIKRDINPVFGTAKNFWGDYTEKELSKEGKRLYKKHPEYEYLEEDPYIKYWAESDIFHDENVFYESVVYAYMVDQILKEHPEFSLEKLELPRIFPENTTGMLTLLPGQWDTDGFFISKMRRQL